MTKISIEVPDYLHFKLKRRQLEREICGEKVTLKELYVELIQKVIEQDPGLQEFLREKNQC